jgi:N-acetylneuraminic acid mutarotase
MLAPLAMLLLSSTWPASRSGHCAVVIGDRAYLFGGAPTSPRSNHYILDVECVDLDKQTVSVPTQMPAPRGMAAAAELNGEIYIAGGMDDQNEDTRTLYRFDPIKNAWKECAPMHAARSRFTLTEHRGKLYAIGAVHESSVEIYDPAKDTWSAGPNLPTVLHAHAAVDYQGHITVLGGNGPDETNSMLWLDDGARVWRNGPKMNITRTFFAAFAYHGALYAVGNHRGSEHPEVLEPGAASWKFLSQPDCRAQRFASCLHNDTIYVFGSEDAHDPPIWTMRLPQ